MVQLVINLIIVVDQYGAGVIMRYQDSALMVNSYYRLNKGLRWSIAVGL